MSNLEEKLKKLLKQQKLDGLSVSECCEEFIPIVKYEFEKVEIFVKAKTRQLTTFLSELTQDLLEINGENSGNER